PLRSEVRSEQRLRAALPARGQLLGSHLLDDGVLDLAAVLEQLTAPTINLAELVHALTDQQPAEECAGDQADEHERRAHRPDSAARGSNCTTTRLSPIAAMTRRKRTSMTRMSRIAGGAGSTAVVGPNGPARRRASVDWGHRGFRGASSSKILPSEALARGATGLRALRVEVLAIAIATTPQPHAGVSTRASDLAAAEGRPLDARWLPAHDSRSTARALFA